MTTAQTPLHQECADFATSLRSASSVAMATRGAAPSSFLRAAGLFESAAAELRRLQADNEAMRETLEFVERWAVHHASKPHMTAELALGSIQHHPEIRAITERYADGKRPDTFDPYARIAELEARKPLPSARVHELLDVAGYLGASARERADFINGLRHGEGARGITGGSS